MTHSFIHLKPDQVIDPYYGNNFSSVAGVHGQAILHGSYVGGGSSFDQGFEWLQQERASNEHGYAHAQHKDSIDSNDNTQQSSPSSSVSNGATVRDSTDTQPIPSADHHDEQRPKKSARAQQACANCRTKKAKCDEKYPDCTNCRTHGIQCVRQSAKPERKGPPLDFVCQQVIKLMKGQSDMATSQSSMRSDMATLDKNVATIANALTTFMKDMDTFRSDWAQSQPVSLPVREGAFPLTHNAQAVIAPSFPEMPTPTQALAPAPALSCHVGDAHQIQRHGRLSMPIRHSTPAHKLITKVKRIQQYYREVPEFNYVMDREFLRDDLLSYGIPALDDMMPPESQVDTPGAHSLTHQYSIPTLHDGKTHTNAGLGYDPPGLLQRESHIANSLWQSYLQHIYKLLPFLDMQHIDGVVKKFASLVGLSVPRNTSFQSSRTLSQTDNLNASAKRRRTEDSPWDTDLHVAKIETATVLLVFALGAISQSPSPMDMDGSSAYINSPPDLFDSSLRPASTFTLQDPPIRYSTFRKAGLYVSRSMKDHPLQDPCVITSETSDGWVAVEKRPTGIPGLEYYKAASNILGQLPQDLNLTSVHAKLLAGLYTSQLLRARESWEWIKDASHSMVDILHANPESLSPDNRNSLLDPIRTTFYSCHLLESDLLAELELDPSGISRYENCVSLPGAPHNVTDDLSKCSIDIINVMSHFHQQICLRKTLNRVHTVMYDSDTEENMSPNCDWGVSPPSALLASLENWRASLCSSNLWWEDSDPRATEINDARMRAKYSGGKVIINRPALLRALDFFDENKHLRSQNASFSSDNTFFSFSSSVDPLPNNTQLLDEETEQGAKRCIAALIKSTKAFDGHATMPQRLIVTNLFGTFQAQFGNILMLAAVVDSERFSTCISLSEFIPLWERTKIFLSHLKPLAVPTIAMHLTVLDTIKRDVILRLDPNYRDRCYGME